MKNTRTLFRRAIVAVGFLAIAITVSCSDSESDTADTQNPPPSCVSKGALGWQVLDKCRKKGELLGVGGTGPTDVWTVGANGQVLSFDGGEWKSHESGVTEDLWWVHAFKDGPVMIAGSGGHSTPI